MKKFFILLILTLIATNMTFAKDIMPITHDSNGDTDIALDLDSVKPTNNGTYTAELIFTHSIPSVNKLVKENERLIYLKEFDLANKQERTIEIYARDVKSWKITQALKTQQQIKESELGKWAKIKESKGIWGACVITCSVGKFGKQWLMDNYSR